jgi:hypothetical protein
MPPAISPEHVADLGGGLQAASVPEDAIKPAVPFSAASGAVSIRGTVRKIQIETELAVR